MVSERAVKKAKPSPWRPTRRELLGAAAAASLGLLADSDTSLGQSTRPTALPPRASRLPELPWWLRQLGPQSRVVEVRSRKVLHVTVVDRVVLEEMLDQGIKSLTGAATVEEAWRTVLGPAQRIVLKFNSVGARTINTNGALASPVIWRILTSN